MKNTITSLLLLLLSITISFGQFADPAVTGANYVPNTIDVGQTAALSVSFSNAGSSVIPSGSIEVTITTAPTYYSSDGSTVPGGPGGAMFSWVYLGSDIWRGTNIIDIPAFGGGDITLDVVGVAQSPGFETTNVNVQPISNFGAFTNSTNNDNSQVGLMVNLNCNPVNCFDISVFRN